MFDYTRKLLIDNYSDQYLAIFTLSIAIFSAIRLAIFNHDTRQSDRFIGVPTPANAFFIVFFVLGIQQGTIPIAPSPLIFVSVAIASSILLVSPLPLIALKFKNFSLKNNWYRYLIFIFAGFGLLRFQQAAIPAIIVIYILLSLSVQVFQKNEMPIKSK